MIALPLEELNAFYCYSHEDQALCEQLERHLSDLKRYYHLKTWFDREILPGENWEQVIEDKLQSADLIFLLISPDFMASDYCYNKELGHALARHHLGEARAIPIHLRPVHWKHAPFSAIQMLPKDALPVTSWSNIDEAFDNITLGIEKVIEDFLDARKMRKVSEIGQEEQISASPEISPSIEEKPVAHSILNDMLTCIYNGDALYSLEKYEEAIGSYKQAIQFIPNFAMKSNYNSDPPVDLQTAEQEILLEPKNNLAYRNKCYALLELRHYEEAFLACEQAIRLSSQAIDYSNKAYALNGLNRYEEALSACGQAFALSPRLSVAYKNQGHIFYNLKRYSEALLACEWAIQINPRLTPAYAIMGITLFELHRPKEACQAFAQWSERYLL